MYSALFKTLLVHPPLLLCRSFEEMEAQITAGMKTPVLSSRAGPEGSAGDKGRKRESEALNTERNEQVCCVCCCAGRKITFVIIT